MLFPQFRHVLFLQRIGYMQAHLDKWAVVGVVAVRHRQLRGGPRENLGHEGFDSVRHPCLQIGKRRGKDDVRLVTLGSCAEGATAHVRRDAPQLCRPVTPGHGREAGAAIWPVTYRRQPCIRNNPPLFQPLWGDAKGYPPPQFFWDASIARSCPL